MNIGTEVNSIEQLSTLQKSRKKHSQKVSHKTYVEPAYVLDRSFTIPCYLLSCKNARQHWSVRSRDNNIIRDKVNTFCCYVFKLSKIRKGKSITVTITRYGKRKMDDDNLSNSCYVVRDEVARCLCIDDGDSRIEWVYKQEIGKSYGCKVAIEVR